MTTTPAAHGNRLDALDGIRTIAVFLVVFFHVSMPRMAAGYIGVDIFFVLSGYLITGGLIRQLRDKQHISLAEFWARRIKRLMPAALLVIIVVLLWAYFTQPLFRQSTISTDSWWTVFYLANWRFIDSASYFASDGTTSPLLHMWSLAVEEQFYLGWPLLMALAGLLIWRRGRRDADAGKRAVRVAGVAALIVCVVSGALLWFWYQPDAPERAYMGTDSKAFEPMLGALLAMLVSNERIKAWATKWARLLIWGGGLTMAGLFLVLDGPPPLYFTGGAVLFSLATGLFIVGIAHALTGAEARVFAWAPSVIWAASPTASTCGTGPMRCGSTPTVTGISQRRPWSSASPW